MFQFQSSTLKKQVEQLNKQVETLTKERDSMTAEVQKLKTPKSERNQVIIFQQTPAILTSFWIHAA